MSIRPFDKYKDKNGNPYQVIATAISFTTESEEIVVQQLYGGYVNISIPKDKFERIFTRVESEEDSRTAASDNNTMVPEKRTAINKPIDTVKKPTVIKPASSPEVVVRPSPATITTVNDSDEDTEQTPAVRDMLAFLDTDDFDEKYMIIEHMAQNDELNDTFIDNMAASIDIVIDDGPLDGRIKELLKCVGTRKHFEGTRLRD